MTLPAVTGGAVAVPEDESTGLEDFDQSDYVMPRIGINHKEAQFTDNLSGASFTDLTVVLLGLVKQRIMWDAEVEEGDKPLCKSLDFTNGHPDDKRFPWESSNFDRKTIEVKDDSPIVVPCAGCAFKEWGSNPKSSTPWCSEQHTFPLLMQVDGGLVPALFTTQRTGIKPSKTYLTAFARTKTPLYTCFTKLTLRAEHRGTVDYAVPVFVKGDPTEQTEWAYYAQQYRQIRSFITTMRAEVETEDSTATTTSVPAAAASSTAPADNEDLPF